MQAATAPLVFVLIHQHKQTDTFHLIDHVPYIPLVRYLRYYPYAALCLHCISVWGCHAYADNSQNYATHFLRIVLVPISLHCILRFSILVQSSRGHRKHSLRLVCTFVPQYWKREFRRFYCVRLSCRCPFDINYIDPHKPHDHKPTTRVLWFNAHARQQQLNLL